MQHDLLTLSEHVVSSPDCSGIPDAHSSFFCVVFGRSFCYYIVYPSKIYVSGHHFLHVPIYQLRVRLSASVWNREKWVKFLEEKRCCNICWSCAPEKECQYYVIFSNTLQKKLTEIG